MKQLEKQDYTYAIHLLCKAFEHNKSVLTVCRHAKRIPELMRYCLYTSALQNLAFITDDKSAVVLCTKPQLIKPTLKQVLYQLKFALCGIGVFHIHTVLKRESRIHAQHPTTPYLHLMFIGVDVSMQGQGIGSAMLTEIKQMTQATKLPIVLETSTIQNIDFYISNGFTLYAQEKMYGYMLYFFIYPI
ncbi:MAG TPA: GNAT family N-acetyltransferase [Bacteroidales bacterium]|nr:GNAT family N-acetyltransferase [Bacteroidales bacterium]